MMTNTIWPPLVTLERDGVRLEPLSLSHEAGLARAAADGELWKIRFTSVPEPHETRSYIETAIKQRTEGSRLAFAVIDITSNTVIGSTSYHDIVPAIARVEIGWTWYAKSYQRSKVNTVCKLLLLQHAFETLGCAVVGWRASHMNFASQRAIERLGAKRDGMLRHHAPIRDGKVRHTVMYSMLASEWQDAKSQLEARLSSVRATQASNSTIRFVEINADNLVTLHRMNAGAVGSQMVAPNAMSVAQAAYCRNAWARAVYVGEEAVGFVMLFDPLLDRAAAAADGKPLDQLYVWRLMVDFKHQGKGYGEQIMSAVIARARDNTAFTHIVLSYVPREGNPKAFYEKLGFRETGRIDDGEIEMALALR